LESSNIFPPGFCWFDRLEASRSPARHWPHPAHRHIVRHRQIHRRDRPAACSRPNRKSAASAAIADPNCRGRKVISLRLPRRSPRPRPGAEISTRRKSTKPAIGDFENAAISCSATCTCGSSMAPPRLQLKRVHAGDDRQLRVICANGIVQSADQRLHHHAVRVELEKRKRRYRWRRPHAAHSLVQSGRAPSRDF